MGIEQKQFRRISCDFRQCENTQEYEIWVNVEPNTIEIHVFDIPDGWDYEYHSNYSYGGSGGSYDFHCPECVKKIKEEEKQREEKAEKDRARNQRKLENRRRRGSQ